LRDNFPLAVAATVIILSFGIVILFVTVGILESNTSQEIKLQQIDKLFDNATVIVKETQNATKYELLQFFNKTSDAIKNNPELQQLQQQWETVYNSTRSKP
jgi:ABC-type amino acid transport substrate-binding protein